MRAGPGPTRHTLLVADEHPVVAHGLAASLAPIFTIAGSVTTLDALYIEIDRHQPDLVLLGLMFGGSSSLAVMRQLIHERKAPCRFLVLTAHDSETFRSEALASGAAGFLTKGVTIQELRLAIEAALAGREVVPPARLERAGGVADAAADVGGVRLRRRQVEVLLHLHNGLTREVIAEQLGITVKGVDYHLKGVKQAVGTRSLRVLVCWVGEHAASLRALLADGSGN
ncbi:MAG: response regulator transcription factor [Gemmatimonadales bacterium]|nr:response regulator transcription factor [Gemmatimonadales bacterium]MDZ4389421.1 response regulator transcription factor [Gemmatimonadales bacterium]